MMMFFFRYDYITYIWKKHHHVKKNIICEWLHHLKRYSTHGEDILPRSRPCLLCNCLNIHLSALLKLCGVLNMDSQLSVQYLINEVGSSLYNRQLPWHCNGMISYFELATCFLLEWGSVLLNVSPLSYVTVYKSNRYVWWKHPQFKAVHWIGQLKVWFLFKFISINL